MITLMAEGGLCNRMRAIDSALSLARTTGHDLQVIWTVSGFPPPAQGFQLGCSFAELFQIPHGVRVRDVRLPFPAIFYHAYFARSSDLRLFNSDLGSGWHDDPSKYVDPARFAAARRVYIRSFNRFFVSEHPYREFVPVEPLQRIINEYVNGFVSVVGVHIRRTDHPYSRRNSPTHRFVALMREEITRNPDTRFFVATDSPEEEALLRREFPGRIISHRKTSLSRNDPRGVKDAVIDLYCLVGCRKLIGSHWSSFTDVAYSIRGIDHIIAMSGNP